MGNVKFEEWQTSCPWPWGIIRREEEQGEDENDKYENTPSVLFPRSDSFWLRRHLNLTYRFFSRSFPTMWKKYYWKNFFISEKNIFLIEIVDRHQKSTRKVSKEAQATNNWAKFSNSKERSRKRFSVFYSIKNYLRIYYKNIILFSLYWSHRGDKDWERATWIAWAGCSEKGFLENEALACRK